MTTLINVIDQTINFNEFTIRIVGTHDRPLFVASDICKVLGLSNVTETLRSLPDKWKEICDIRNSEVTYTTRKTQEMYCITEAGLYRIIMRSNKEVVQSFQEVILQFLKLYEGLIKQPVTFHGNIYKIFIYIYLSYIKV